MLIPRSLLSILLVACCSFWALAHADDFRGRVVGVADGDTITVLHEGRGVRIRLQGVDAPEKDQPFGSKAKQLTSSLVFGKEVTVRVSTTDRYGRSVAWVYLPTGACLNEEIVKAGLAWHYKHFDKSRRLAELEAQARAARRGLWADAASIPPWDWRHQQGKGRPASHAARAGTAAVAGPLHGNTSAKVVHRPGCRDYDCKHCTRNFTSLKQALAAGYRPCGSCRPDRVQTSP